MSARIADALRRVAERLSPAPQPQWFTLTIPCRHRDGHNQ